MVGAVPTGARAGRYSSSSTMPARPATRKEIILRCRDLCKVVTASGETIRILDKVSLQVNAGSSLAITGASGSGKTTLLGLLAGLDVPSAGDIQIQGQSLCGLDEDARAALRNRYIGFVFQSFHLMPGFTALENVMLPLEIKGRTDARQRAAELLQRVGLGSRLQHFPDTLSGGEQQRVAIARAFAPEPPLLFADEPTGNLDAGTGRAVMDLLFQLNEEAATTLVLITHDRTLSERCARRLQLQAGRLLGPGEAAEGSL